MDKVLLKIKSSFCKNNAASLMKSLIVNYHQIPLENTANHWLMTFAGVLSCINKEKSFKKIKSL